MARRSTRKSSNRPQGRRVNPSPFNNARLRLHPLPPMVSRPYVGYDALRGRPRPPRNLRLVEDRRTWFPSIARPAKSYGRRSDTKLVIPSNPLKSVRRLPHKVAFAVPRRIAICVRRAIRREVIHATGMGGGKVSRPKRNEFSEVKC